MMPNDKAVNTASYLQSLPSDDVSGRQAFAERSNPLAIFLKKQFLRLRSGNRPERGNPQEQHAIEFAA
jgi:hypothetical protein